MKPIQAPEQSRPKVVVCPACKGNSIYGPGNAFRPFCSQRCKNMDLGAWASESFRMPVDAQLDDDPYSDPTLQ